MGLVNSCCNNPVAKAIPIGGAVVGFVGAVLAATVTSFVLYHLAFGYLYSATGLTGAVVQTSLHTILDIAKWSSVAAAAGLGLGIISSIIVVFQLSKNEKYRKEQN